MSWLEVALALGALAGLVLVWVLAPPPRPQLKAGRPPAAGRADVTKVARCCECDRVLPQRELERVAFCV